MNKSGKIVETIRRRTNRAFLRSTILQVPFASGIAAFGWYFPSFCTDCKNYPVLKYVVAGFLVLVGLLWLLGIFSGVHDRSKPAGKPLNAQLAQYGDYDAVARDMESDFAVLYFESRRIHIGQKWLCYSWKTQVNVLRIDAIIWAYFERVRHSINFIPTGTTKQLIAWSRNGSATVMPLRNKKEVGLALAALSQAAPWMLVGYTDVIRESWNNDREDLLAVVDRARLKAGE